MKLQLNSYSSFFCLSFPDLCEADQPVQHFGAHLPEHRQGVRGQGGDERRRQLRPPRLSQRRSKVQRGSHRRQSFQLLHTSQVGVLY